MKPRIATSGHIEMLAMIKKGGATGAEISAAMGYQPHTVSSILFRMRSQGLIHISEWNPPAHKGVHIPRYRFGPGTDAPYTGNKAPRWLEKKSRVKLRSEVIATASLFHELMAGECSMADLLAATGMSRGFIGNSLRHARKHGLARICKWERRQGVGGSPTPYWSLGSGPDAQKPKPKSNTERCREYMNRRATIETNRLLMSFRAVEMA